MKKKTKGKELRLDLTKDGKLDVSFLRVERTKKQINADAAATYLTGMAVKNGFYHPKKIYTIFDRVIHLFKTFIFSILLTISHGS